MFQSWRGILATVAVTSSLLVPLPAPVFAQDNVQRQILRAQNRVLPSLVHVVPVQEFYVGGERQKRLSTGSGVIFREDGYVITNHHVIGQGKKMFCVLSDEREIPATVVGSDPYTDIAVLKLDEDALGGRVPAARFGNSDRLKQGQFVLALGSPLGLVRSVSLGVVSTTDRVLDELGNVGRFNTWIQTDAAINPGNSGGPLIDTGGRVVGINTRGIVGGAQNLGFAIPGNLAKEIAEELIASGSVERSTLGVSFQSIESVRGRGPSTQVEGAQGAIVSDVDPGGPADVGGLRVGDMVLALDGEAVDGRYDELIPALRKRISDIPLDTEISLDILRNGEHLSLPATTSALDKFFADEFQAEAWGLTMKAVTDTIRVRWRLDDLSGAIVASSAPGKSGHVAGLRGNDVVYVFDDEAVRDLDHFKELYATALEEQRERIMLQVRNGSFFRFVLVKPSYEDTAQEDDDDESGDDADDTSEEEADAAG